MIYLLQIAHLTGRVKDQKASEVELEAPELEDVEPKPCQVPQANPTCSKLSQRRGQGLQMFQGCWIISI